MTYAFRPGRAPGRLQTLRAVRGVLAVFFVLAGSASGAAGQSEAEDASSVWAPPETVAAEARLLVAERWGVDPDDLLLEWTAPRASVSLQGIADVDVLGGGRNGHWIVTVLLENSDPQRLSLPVRAGIQRLVPVASTPLARGETLETKDMDYERRVHWGPAGDFPEVAEEGWVTQRTFDMGDLLSRPGVRPPLMVVSGGTVQLIWTSGALKISLDGVAVGSGAMGETIFVRTEGGNRMSGVITGPGTVLLSTPGTRGES